jgi:hypothetical protein
MTEEERNQVLKMVEDGKISPEEGLKLIQVLDQPPEDQETSSKPEDGEPSKPHVSFEQSSFAVDPRIEKVKSTVRRLWQIPLWIGIATTVISAFGMFKLMDAGKTNFWFYFLILPLLLGVALVAAAVGSRKAHWLFVNVQQKPGERPNRIFLGFPLPLKLTAWFLRTFGHNIPELRKTNVDEVIQVIETGFTADEPLVVNVDEGEEGERVQVYIG